MHRKTWFDHRDAATQISTVIGWDSTEGECDWLFTSGGNDRPDLDF